MWTILAGLVIMMHAIWIGFLILGFPIALYFNRPFWRLLHLAGLAAAAIMHVTDTLCPLTILEGYFKARGVSGSTYPGDFLPRLLEHWIYVDAAVLKIVTYLIIAYTGIVTLSFIFRPVHFKRGA